MAGIGNFLGGTAEGFNASMKNVIASQSVSRARKADKLSAKVAGNKEVADRQKAARAQWEKLVVDIKSEAQNNPQGTLQLIGSETVQLLLQQNAKRIGVSQEALEADLRGALAFVVDPETRANFVRGQSAATAAGTKEGSLEGATAPESLEAQKALDVQAANAAGATAATIARAKTGVGLEEAASGATDILGDAAAAQGGKLSQAQAAGGFQAKRDALTSGVLVGTAEAQMADIEEALGRKLTDEDKERLVGLDNVAKTEVGKLIDDMGLYESGTAEHTAIAKLLDNMIASPGDKQASEYLAWSNEFTNLVGRKPNPAEARAHLGADPQARGELSQLQMGVELAKEMFPDVDGKKSPQVQRAEEALANFGKPSLEQKAGIRKEFTKASQEFVKLSNAFQKIQRAGVDRTAMSDLALIFMFMKVLDPPSTVRDSEARAVATSGQLGEGVRAWLQRAVESRSLTDTQRNELIATAENLYREQLFNHLQLEGQFGSQADQANIPRSQIVIDYVRAADRAGLPKANIFDPAITKEGVREVATFVLPLIQARRSATDENKLVGNGFSDDFMAKLREQLTKHGLDK